MSWTPGDYFDGDTPSTTLWRFSWSGVPHASTSEASRTVRVALVGAGDPGLVQISVPDMPDGEAYRVEGAWGDFVWLVRGGVGVGTGDTVLLTDNRSPLNVPVIYRVTVGGLVWESDPIITPYPGKHVLQSLDGRTSVVVDWMENGLPRAPEVRATAFSVAGRVRPVVRLDVAGAGGGSIVLQTTGPQTKALAALLASGRPVVVRTDGAVRDFAPVEIFLATAYPSELTGAYIQEGDTRRWTVTYLLVDDPEPNTPIASSTWDDFDDVYAGLTWDDFDAQWAGLTWDDFDAFDWAGQA